MGSYAVRVDGARPVHTHSTLSHCVTLDLTGSRMRRTTRGMSSFTIEVPRSTWMCLLLGLAPRHCCLLSSSSFVSLLPMQRRCCPPSAFVYLPLTIPSPLSLSGPCLYPLPCLFVFHSQPCTFAPNISINIPPFDIRHSIFSLPAKRIVLSTHPSRSSSSRPLMTPKNTNIFPFHFSSLYHSDSIPIPPQPIWRLTYSLHFSGRLCTTNPLHHAPHFV